MEQQTENGPRLLYNPQSSTVIHERGKFIVLGDNERIDKLHKLLREY